MASLQLRINTARKKIQDKQTVSTTYAEKSNSLPLLLFICCFHCLTFLSARILALFHGLIWNIFNIKWFAMSFSILPELCLGLILLKLNLPFCTQCQWIGLLQTLLRLQFWGCKHMQCLLNIQFNVSPVSTVCWRTASNIRILGAVNICMPCNTGMT